MLKFSFSVSGKILETGINSITAITDSLPIGIDVMPHVNKILDNLKTRADVLEKAPYGYMTAHKSSNGDIEIDVELEDEFVTDFISICSRTVNSMAPMVSGAIGLAAMAKVTMHSSIKKTEEMSKAFNAKWFPTPTASEKDNGKTKAKTSDPDADTNTSADKPKTKSDDSSEPTTDSKPATDKATNKFKEYGIGFINEEIDGEPMISVQVFRRDKRGKSMGLTLVHNYGDVGIHKYTSAEDERYTRMQDAGNIEWKYDDLIAAKVAMYDLYAELAKACKSSDKKADEDDSVEEESDED